MTTSAQVGEAESKKSLKEKELPDVLLPGEGEDIEPNRRSEFNRSAMTVKSVTSGAGREKWGSKMQFLMSCIASAVGLGNVWRFPAICAKNGGAAFLIPYMIVLFVIARPLLVLELSLGQFSSKGSVRCWDLSPVFTGIGLTGMVSSVLLSSFYIMLLAWALIYFCLSVYSTFSSDVVWVADGSTAKFFGVNILHSVDFDSVDNVKAESWLPIWHLVLALFFAWVIIWAAMAFGVEASGKVAYITALVPYVVLIILLIVGCCLPGAEVGILYFLIPQWGLIFHPETWFQAVGQCFFSLGIGFGGCIMFSSFNEFHNDLIQDVFIIGIVDTVTSVLAGLSLLSILGFEATLKFDKMKKNNDSSDYEDLKTLCGLTRGTEERDLKLCVLEGIVGKEGGAGMAFVQYPAAMQEVNNRVPHTGGILGMLFFFMLVLLAVGSANGFVGTTVTIISDRKPTWKRFYIVLGVCLGSFCLGIIYTNGTGSGWFDVVDQHGVTAVVYILSFLEVIAVVFVYGLKNFCDDMQFMREGKKVGWYLRITWVMLPFLMFSIFIAWLVAYEANKSWTITVKVIAWLLTTCCVLIIPGTAIAKFFEFRKNPWRPNVPKEPMAIIKAVIHPSPRWGPKDPEIRKAWKSFKAESDPSYHLWERFLACITRRSTDDIPPGNRYSYATTAFTVGNRISGIGTSPATIEGTNSAGVVTPHQEPKSRTSNVVSPETK